MCTGAAGPTALPLLLRRDRLLWAAEVVMAPSGLLITQNPCHKMISCETKERKQYRRLRILFM